MHQLTPTWRVFNKPYLAKILLRSLTSAASRTRKGASSCKKRPRPLNHRGWGTSRAPPTHRYLQEEWIIGQIPTAVISTSLLRPNSCFALLIGQQDLMVLRYNMLNLIKGEKYWTISEDYTFQYNHCYTTELSICSPLVLDHSRSFGILFKMY